MQQVLMLFFNDENLIIPITYSAAGIEQIFPFENIFLLSKFWAYVKNLTIWFKCLTMNMNSEHSEKKMKKSQQIEFYRESMMTMTNNSQYSVNFVVWQKINKHRF